MNLSKLTTYQAGVTQARAHRALSAKIGDYLRAHNLTTMQWSVLGFVYDAGKDGVRISDLAKELDTSLAFITNTVNTLEAKRMVVRSEHGSDNRAKLVHVTPEYAPKVASIEKELHRRFRKWLMDMVPSPDLGTYLKVLEQIAHNDSNKDEH